MKKLTVFPVCLGCCFAATASQAMDLKQSKLTQVVNDVQIISAADQKQKTATINDIFSMPDVLRTGAASRAELVAQDETVTRVGANTIFSFDPANRSIDLKQGSLLFHSPHGKGGGTIHTGSATASVLGTTLIVVTTPNGGLKVIALEGEVEVKFLNGLKQKLDPGHMTFILPGANQLAPVIVFRLDELTQNSLLVKGFSQTLESLPLIQNQIDRQLKLIASGKATDTGLYAGDNATPDQVEVLDLNTISHGQQHHELSPPVPPVLPPAPPPLVPDLAAAEAADATINQSSLTDVSIPTPPDHIYTEALFPIPDNSYFHGQSFSGFVARNIGVNTLDGGANTLEVDLSPYTALDTFSMVAMGTFSIEGSVTFKGLSFGDNLQLIAGDQFVLAPGISIGAAARNFLFSSPATLIFDKVSLYNSYRDLTLDSGANVVFQNNSSITAGGKLMINAHDDILATGSSLVGDSAVLTAFTGNIVFNDALLNTKGHSLLFAQSSITLNNSTINSDFVTLSGLGSTTISLENTTINAPSSIVALSQNDIDITGTSITPDLKSAHFLAGSGSALNTDAASGSVVLDSTSRSVNITDTSITAHYLTVNSGDGILLDGYGHTLAATGSGATAKFTAPNLITVNNADLTAYGTVNMSANTINLSDVAFGAGSSVTLKSLFGLLNIGSSIPGDVNFIRNVTYGGNPAQNYVNNGGGIIVTTR